MAAVHFRPRHGEVVPGEGGWVGRLPKEGTLSPLGFGDRVHDWHCWACLGACLRQSWDVE